MIVASSFEAIASPISAAGNGADEIYEGPMIDAHTHLMTNLTLLDRMISSLDKAGVSKVVMFPPFEKLINEDVLEAYRRYPDRIIPFAGLPPENLTDPEIVDVARRALESGDFWGLGEIHFFYAHIPVDHPIMLKIYDHCAEYGVPINVHAEEEHCDELERALEHNRDTIFIWAHAGCRADAYTVWRMMNDHPNLFAELSARIPEFGYTLITNPDGSIKPDWRILLEDHSDRFMWGTDMSPPHDYRYGAEWYVQTTDYYRSILGQLTSETAEKIAYKNIEGILTKATSLSISLSSDSIELGENITVSGFIIPKVKGASVTITYTPPNETSVTSTVMTSRDGNFTDTFTPDTDGEWSVKASWEGDERRNYLATESASISFTVKPLAPIIPIPYVAIGVGVVAVVIVLIIAKSRRKRVWN